MAAVSALASAIARRAWREYADLRRRAASAGSARPALDRIGDVARSDVGAWLAATEGAHDRYRAACAMADGSVAVVTVTNRPDRIGDVVENVARQRRAPDELVVVVNGDRADPTAPVDAAPVDRALDALRRAGTPVTLLERPADVSLGACLNAAMAVTSARFVAKFDDDDRYGPSYLADALRAHGYAGAGVVGKHTFFAHLVERDETILRFPGHEFTYTSTLAGATLVLDRERLGDLGFRDLSVGEDRALLGDCNRRGISTFSADRFGFAYRRASDHSWAVPLDAFVEGSIPIGAGLPLDRIDR